MNIANYQFDGPYTTIANFEDISGVYVILCYSDAKYTAIDCGESATIKSRLENHDRKDCWKRNCSGTICFAVLYTPGLQSAGRVDIEQKIRQIYNPPCGKR